MRVNQTGKFSVRDLVVVGMMAALCYVGAMIHIEIPTPLDRMMFHFGDVFCLAAAMMFGPLRGGLSGGIGLMLFDLLNGWADSALFTLIFKFAEGAICGLIAHSFGRKGRKIGFNVIGSIAGTVTYIALYLGKNFVSKFWMHGMELETVLIDCNTKLINSSMKGVVSVIAACVIASVLILALRKSKISLPGQSNQ